MMDALKRMLAARKAVDHRDRPRCPSEGMRLILAISDRRDCHLSRLDAPTRREIRETWKAIVAEELAEREQETSHEAFRARR